MEEKMESKIDPASDGPFSSTPSSARNKRGRTPRLFSRLLTKKRELGVTVAGSHIE
jgi:hypothetical protein